MVVLSIFEVVCDSFLIELGAEGQVRGGDILVRIEVQGCGNDMLILSIRKASANQ